LGVAPTTPRTSERTKCTLCHVRSVPGPGTRGSDPPRARGPSSTVGAKVKDATSTVGAKIKEAGAAVKDAGHDIKRKIEH